MFDRNVETNPASKKSATSELLRRPVRLRTVEPGMVRLRDRLATGLSAAIGSGAAALRIDVMPAVRQSPEPCGQSLLLQTRTGPLAFTPARELIRALSAIDLPPDNAPDLLHELRIAMAARAMLPEWFALFGASAALSVSDAPVSGADQVHLDMALQQPSARWAIAATLSGTSEAVLDALTHPGWQCTPQRTQVLPPDWTMSFPVLAGQTALSTVACRSLAPGDVILMRRPCIGLDGHGELRIGRNIASYVLHAGNHVCLELTEWHAMTTGGAMDELLDDLPQAGFDAADPLDDLPVVLSFELGTLELSLIDLKDLAPGRVLAMQRSLPPQVAVRAGGRHIATGELVEVDGRLGVEILRMGGLS